jgi:hypothetical protein
LPVEGRTGDSRFLVALGMTTRKATAKATAKAEAYPCGMTTRKARATATAIERPFNPFWWRPVYSGNDGEEDHFWAA